MRLAGITFALASFALAQDIEFNRDIRPILSDKCFHCHGPDAGTRKTKLRLDVESGAKIDLAGGRKSIVPGHPEQSELYRRVSSTDKAVRMPPVYSQLAPLTEREIALVSRWIAQGATWQRHWSLNPPRRAPLPTVSKPDWVRNAVDAFVLSKLDREGLAPSPEAAKETLLRRVTLDLTGLPPKVAEVEAFLADTRADAYDRVVDRLLASSAFGERMAIRWLEAARYADTNGYQTDGPRQMWRWRDWVIDAFRHNMPFDQFTIEQLAGDLLPSPTLSQRVATAFHRNHRTTAEGGIVDEEFRVEYVADRVETTSTVWMGLTLGCSRCHDHKYDPFKQKEFYQLFAFFNNVPEKGFVYNFGNEEPYIKAPTPEQRSRLIGLDEAVTQARRQWSALAGDVQPVAHGEFAGMVDAGRVATELLPTWPLDRWSKTSPLGKAQAEWQRQLQAQRNIDWIPSTALALDHRPGRPIQLDGKTDINLGPQTGKLDHRDPYTFAATFRSESPTGAIFSRNEDYWEGSGYGLYLLDGKLRFHFTMRWTDLGLRVESANPIKWDQWQQVALTYDGSMKATRMHLYVNGIEQPLKIVFDQNLWPLDNKVPFRIGAGGGEKYRFRGEIASVRFWKRELAPAEIQALAEPETLDTLARKPAGALTTGQAAKLRLAFLESHLPAELARVRDSVLDAEAARFKYWLSLPTVMVMVEGARPRPAYLLKRGAYDAHGDEVQARVPEALPPLPPGAAPNRLGLARWLTSPDHPLTARVAVNRFWQMLFGTGLVKTVEDFGSQGEWPIHPELLDWLAVDFRESGWDVKYLLRTIVTSNAYRQSSKASPALIERDPENRLLARGPRMRLSPEMVRDQALAASGLLTEKVGGPSVRPPQPPGLWQELAGGKDYEADPGEGRYRRSLYTYWRRTIAPPSMVTFDSPTRETCVVRETRTNTPLQALNLMNDGVFLEAARKLGDQMAAHSGDPLAWAFLRVLGRAPRPAELEVLSRTYRQFHDRYQTDPGAAAKFASRDGAQAPGQAAYTAVASLILNLDEAVTKE